MVDNGSSDGSPQAAREHAPWATVLEPGENLGFGPAVNAVADRATGEWLLLANADIALESGALGAMLAAGRDRRVGCVAPRLVLADGTTQHSVHSFPTLSLALAFNLGLGRLSRALAERLCLPGGWNPERPRVVSWALGACLLVRRAAFTEVGGFDRGQWMYAEDIELGWRLRDHGWLTLYTPSARVRHESAAATEAAFGEQRMATFLSATYALLMRRCGAPRTWASAAVNVVGAAARWLWMTPPALLSARWRDRRSENLRWLRAHVQAARSLSTLRRQR